MRAPPGRKNSRGFLKVTKLIAAAVAAAVAVVTAMGVEVRVKVEVLSIQQNYKEKGKINQPSYEPIVR